MTTIITTGSPFQSDGDWSMWGTQGARGTDIKMDSVQKAEPMLERHAGQDEEEEMEKLAKKALKKVQNMPLVGKKAPKAKAVKKPAKKPIAKKKQKTPLRSASFAGQAKNMKKKTSMKKKKR